MLEFNLGYETMTAELIKKHVVQPVRDADIHEQGYPASKAPRDEVQEVLGRDQEAAQTNILHLVLSSLT